MGPAGSPDQHVFTRFGVRSVKNTNKMNHLHPERTHHLAVEEKPRQWFSHLGVGAARSHSPKAGACAQGPAGVPSGELSISEGF